MKGLPVHEIPLSAAVDSPRSAGFRPRKNFRKIRLDLVDQFEMSTHQRIFISIGFVGGDRRIPPQRNALYRGEIRATELV